VFQSECALGWAEAEKVFYPAAPAEVIVWEVGVCRIDRFNSRLAVTIYI